MPSSSQILIIVVSRRLQHDFLSDVFSQHRLKSRISLARTISSGFVLLSHCLHFVSNQEYRSPGRSPPDSRSCLTSSTSSQIKNIAHRDDHPRIHTKQHQTSGKQEGMRLRSILHLYRKTLDKQAYACGLNKICYNLMRICFTHAFQKGLP